MTTPADDSQPAASDRDPLGSLEQSFATLFRFVKSNVRESAALLDPELPPAAWTVLRHLVRESPLQVGALASATGMDKSSISRHLRELRERGFVEMTHSADDARAVLVRPSQLAVDRVGTALDATRGRYRRFLATWNEDQLEQFSVLLARFAEIERFTADEASASRVDAGGSASGPVQRATIGV
ncbi:MarR family winged helix-turn-helix transcriptional regulator [Amnibacterium flavum]|uniref:MarR family winged helix-turn-helix transcriptional regulator n=1 Tax=Amnibacterium flavum TaxID=2173173 RepID=UPI0014030FE5|nr:MarR family winged helix-turn-helix transcriptional regulator [Amnibacterium flavum]